MSIRSSADIAAHLNDAEGRAMNDLTGSAQAVGALMSKWPNTRGIYGQLQRLATFIARTRDELSTLRPDEVKRDFLPRATDELDAIVEATAAATHRIMDATDVISTAASRMQPADRDATMAAITSIYEACTFQDITGQRVTKVVTMLKVIETRIDKMIEAMGGEQGAVAAAVSEPTSNMESQASQSDIDDLFATPAGEAGTSQLHGPALPGQGRSQSEIDALLAEG